MLQKNDIPLTVIGNAFFRWWCLTLPFLHLSEPPLGVPAHGDHGHACNQGRGVYSGRSCSKVIGKAFFPRWCLPLPFLHLSEPPLGVAAHDDHEHACNQGRGIYSGRSCSKALFSTGLAVPAARHANVQIDKNSQEGTDRLY